MRVPAGPGVDRWAALRLLVIAGVAACASGCQAEGEGSVKAPSTENILKKQEQDAVAKGESADKAKKRMDMTPLGRRRSITGGR